MPPTLTQTQRHLLTLIARDNGTLLLEAMINEHACGYCCPDRVDSWATPPPREPPNG